MNAEPEILFDRLGVAGIVTLNRPRALNALTHGMVVAMKAKLEEWAEDEAIRAVVVRGAGERAFCSGGDIRAVRESGLAGTSYGRDFWHDEYILNAAIKHYPKPYIALIHGVCMGGGIGVAVHGQYRLTDGSALFAMPETGIGFFPDVGGSWFLPRCPGEIGMYMGLTGARLKLTDALYVGLATHAVPMTKWPELLDVLSAGEHADKAVAQFAEPPPPDAPLAAQRKDIDRIFSGGSVEDILARLDAGTDAWSRETAATMRTRSPTSLRLVYREVRTGRTIAAFDDCMRMEYRMAVRILEGHDFYEGVRAVLIDRDNTPRWKPPTLAEVPEAAVASYFAPLGEGELRL